MEEILDIGRDFLKNIRPDERVAILYHRDLDGMCAGLLVKAVLERCGKKVSGINYGFYRELKSTAQKLKYDKLIITDIGMNPDFCRTVEKPTLIIDHHLVKCTDNEKIAFVNPRTVNPEAYQPAAYIVYKIFSKIVDLSDKEWLVVLGIAGDYAFDDCLDVLKKWTKAKTREELLTKTDIGKAAVEISGALFELGFEKVLSILSSSTGIEDVRKNADIKAASEKYQKLYDKGMKEFWGNSERIGNIIFSVIKPPHEGMGSGIVNRVSRENPDKFIFLFEDLGDKYDIDARHQEEGVHLGKLMEKLVGGGGHRSAAGGIVAKDDLESLKKKLLKELKIA